MPRPDFRPPQTPEAWLETGRAVLDDFLAALARHGVEPHPALRLLAGESPTPYYEPATRTIVLGMPDPGEITGRLHWLMIARLVGVAGVDEAVAVLGEQLPVLVAHEVVHHLRHHYSAPTENDFIEEQVANTVAIAFVQEHPRYRGTLERLHAHARRSNATLAVVSPETRPYLPGFRLEVGDLLVAGGHLDAARLAELTALADAVGQPVESVLADAVPRSVLDEVEHDRSSTEAYFNRRYMAAFSEYSFFLGSWFDAYLVGDEFPTLGEALERHVLTGDWERARRDETLRLIATTLRHPDDELAAAAAGCLPSEAGSAAVPVLLRALEMDRPVVQTAALEALRELAAGDAAIAEAAERLLASTSPPVSAAAAVFLLEQGTGGGTGEAVLEALLVGGREERRAALGAVAASGDPSFVAVLAAHVSSDAADERRLALQGLKRMDPMPAVAEVAAIALSDPADEVRQAAASCLGAHATAGTLPRLVEALGDPCTPVRSVAAQALLAQGDTAVAALQGLHGSWRARAHAAQVMLDIDEEQARTPALDLTDELAGRAVAMAAAGRAVASAGEWDAILRTGLSQEARELALLAVELSGAVARAEGAEVALRGLRDKQPAVRRTALALTQGWIAAPMFARLATVLLESQDKGVAHVAPPTPAELEELLVAPEPFLRELCAHYLIAAEAGATGRGGTDKERGMLSTIEKLMFLRSTALFAAVDLEDLRPLAEDFIVRRYRLGEPVFRAGEPAKHLLVVVSGRVAIEQARDGGESVRIAEIGARAHLGEVAMLSGRPHSRSAVALEDTTLLALERDHLTRVGLREPRILLSLARVLAERLSGLEPAYAAPAGGRTLD